jgi:hypothetical protein
MNTDECFVVLTMYEYDVLNKNRLVSTLCKKQLQSAAEHPEGVELSMTLDELEDLTGYVAAEANHAKSKKQRRELGEICDNLEALVSQAKRARLQGSG